MNFKGSDSPQSKGDKILSHIRQLIENATTNDDERFIINRWIHARLQGDERKNKRKIKKQLYEKNPKCSFCKDSFSTDKGVEVHRKNGKRGYHKNNCVLAHKKCHQTSHQKAGKEVVPSHTRRKSISGEYEFIRHLVEELFVNNPEITCAQMKIAVLEEFPISAFKKSHYSWYKTKIMSNGEFKYL